MTEKIENESAKRPGFLTTLCILTFIGSGLSFILEIYGLIKGGGSLVDASIIGPFSDNTLIGSIAGLVSYGLCFYGAIKMWALKKQGYMLYLVGCVIAIAIPFINILLGQGDFVEGGVIVVTSIINILFIVLYSVNKKHLKFDN